MGNLSTLTEQFVEKIRAARSDANLSQRELADRLGVSVRTVQAWEAGTVPQPRHRRALDELIFLKAAAPPIEGVA